MKTRLAVVLCLGSLAACRNVDLPPPPGAGAITGRVLVAAPGEAVGQPSPGATVELVEGGLSTTTDADGRFDLRPISMTRGTLRFSQGPLVKVMSLEAIGAAPGKLVVLGDVALSRNASVQGQVTLEGASLHEGTLVFVEGEPASTYTTRDGQFLLRELPVGPVSLAIFHAGFGPLRLQLELRSGERTVLDPLVLHPQPPGTAVVRGHALLSDSEDARGITVAAAPRSTTTPSSGTWSVDTVDFGVHSFSFTHDGYRTVTLINRLVAAPEVALPDVVLTPGSSTSPVVVPPFPGFDAGSDDAGTDAGTMDAGSDDAGTDAGGMDAGSMDAGTDAGSVDAGTTDAGIDAGTDAGVVDAGSDAGTDAGTDAGPDLFPIAVIAPLPAILLQDAGPIVLDGTGSVGTPVLTRYSWSIDAGTARLRDGGVVKPSVNDTAFSAAPSLELPLPPAVVTVSLQVSDVLGRTSASASTGFVVGDRPLALFDGGSLPVSLYSNQSATIDATPSRDTVGSGLVSRRWATSPAGAPITTTSLNGNQQLRIDVGTVPFSQQVTVSHWVTNGLGIESLERLHTFTLVSGSLPSSPWSVSTSGAFVVDGGVATPLVAKLDAGSMTAAYADPLNYDWAWTSSTDAGTPPTWAITDPTRDSTTFIPPVVEGNPVRYDFTITATPRPPLAPGPQSANLVILAQDRVRPTLVSYSSSGAVGSAMGTLLTFSEAMQPVTNANIDVARVSNNVSVINGRVFKSNQFLLVTRPPPFAAETWEFRMSQSANTVMDVIGNQVNPLDATTQYRASFLPEVRWTAPFELATGELTVEPAPGVAIVPTNTLGQHTGVVVARQGTTLVTATTPLFTSCSTGTCAITPAPFASATPTANQPALSYFVHQGAPYFQPVPGSAWSADGGALPTAPGLIFSQGQKLGTAYVSGTTLKVADLDGGAWDTTNAVTAWTSTGAYPIDGTTTVQTASALDLSGTRATCIVLQTGTKVVPLSRLNSGAFGIPLTNNPAASGLSVTQVRGFATTAFCTFAYVLTSGAVVYSHIPPGDFGTSNNLQTFVAGGVSEVDIIQDVYNSIVNSYWLASIESGQLYLYYSTGTAGTRVPLPLGATSLNADPSCLASKPTLTQYDQAIYVTWQERCAGQQWKVYTRALW